MEDSLPSCISVCVCLCLFVFRSDCVCVCLYVCLIESRRNPHRLVWVLASMHVQPSPVSAGFSDAQHTHPKSV